MDAVMIKDSKKLNLSYFEIEKSLFFCEDDYINCSKHYKRLVKIKFDKLILFGLDALLGLLRNGRNLTNITIATCKIGYEISGHLRVGL